MNGLKLPVDTRPIEGNGVFWELLMLAGFPKSRLVVSINMESDYYRFSCWQPNGRYNIDAILEHSQIRIRVIGLCKLTRTYELKTERDFNLADPDLISELAKIAAEWLL